MASKRCSWELENGKQLAWGVVVFVVASLFRGLVEEELAIFVVVDNDEVSEHSVVIVVMGCSRNNMLTLSSVLSRGSYCQHFFFRQMNRINHCC